MKIVLDTNILISALIKDSTSRKIIIESGLDFFYPEISFKEIMKYENEILKKSGYAKEQFWTILNKLLEYIILMPIETIQPKIKEASDIMNKIDSKDIIFLASALSIQAYIWTEDRDFEKQNSARILKTLDLVKEFEKTKKL